MRDTVRLSRRLCVLACLPMLASGCDTPPPSSKPKADASAKSAPADKGAKPKAKPPTKAAPAKRKRPKGPIINEAPAPAPVDPKVARFEPIPGDPPWIDGYNPEEDPCPSGNWCGTIDTAMAVAPNSQAIAKEMDCPTRIVGSKKPSPVKGAKYAGLSPNNAMQGSLNQHGTELAREAGKADACCYHWFDYCSGRPLIDEGRALVAEPVEGVWADGRGCERQPSPVCRAELTSAWLRDAVDEHASVAAFSRVVLELMAVGAPAHLLAATTDAARDEIGHAARCFEIASAIAGRPLGPGPLPVAPVRAANLQQVAVDAFVEGCVGETTAALVAERSAALATDPLIKEALGRTADDETRHAALAWRTLAWAMQQGGADVREAVRQAADQLRPPQAPVELAPAQRHADWNAFGRLDDVQRNRAVLDARRDIVGPMLDQLLGQFA